VLYDYSAVRMKLPDPHFFDFEQEQYTCEQLLRLIKLECGECSRTAVYMQEPDEREGGLPVVHLASSSPAPQQQQQQQQQEEDMGQGPAERVNTAPAMHGGSRVQQQQAPQQPEEEEDDDAMDTAFVQDSSDEDSGFAGGAEAGAGVDVSAQQQLLHQQWMAYQMAQAQAQAVQGVEAGLQNTHLHSQAQQQQPHATHAHHSNAPASPHRGSAIAMKQTKTNRQFMLQKMQRMQAGVLTRGGAGVASGVPPSSSLLGSSGGLKMPLKRPPADRSDSEDSGSNRDDRGDRAASSGYGQQPAVLHRTASGNGIPHTSQQAQGSSSGYGQVANVGVTSTNRHSVKRTYTGAGAGPIGGPEMGVTGTTSQVHELRSRSAGAVQASASAAASAIPSAAGGGRSMRSGAANPYSSSGGAGAGAGAGAGTGAVVESKSKRGGIVSRFLPMLGIRR